MRQLALLIGIAVLTAGCACLQAAHAQDPGCVVVNDIVDCTKDATIQTVVPLFADIIAQQSANVDWTSFEGQIVSKLAAMGFKDGGCIIATLEAEFSKKATVAQNDKPVMSVHSVLNNWKSKHGVTSVKFKVKDAEGNESLR